MRARYYDPTIGRFASEDPSGDGENWYLYCADNPVGLIDSDGKMFGIDDFAAVALIFCIVAAVVLIVESILDNNAPNTTGKGKLGKKNRDMGEKEKKRNRKNRRGNEEDIDEIIRMILEDVESSSEL